MNDCRAAVITAHNQPLEIQRVPIPDPLEPGALLSENHRLNPLRHRRAPLAWSTAGQRYIADYYRP